MKQDSTASPDPWEGAYLYSTEALFVVDADGALSQWSESFARTVGRAALRGTTLSQLFHQDDREVFAATWSRLDETTSPLEVPVRVRTGEDLYTPFSCALRRAPQGGAVHGSLRQAKRGVDGVDGVAGRSRGGEPANVLRVLSHNLPIIVWAIDREGKFTYYDGKHMEGAGLKPEQFLGLNLFEVFSNAPSESEAVRQALRGYPGHTLTHIHNAFWENWMVPIQGSLGDVESVIGLSLDISESKKTEQELSMRLLQVQKQQEVIGKLSTPIIQVWEGVLALPMVGVVDSARTADVMQNLLDEIVRTGAHYAILDLTGVEMVDTQVADHLVKLVSAIQLLGAGGIICGIRPSVAQTIVTLAIDLDRVVTRANLKDGIMFCIDRMRRLDKTAPPAAR